jgi:hypothetical protein
MVPFVLLGGRAGFFLSFSIVDVGWEMMGILMCRLYY